MEYFSDSKSRSGPSTVAGPLRRIPRVGLPLKQSFLHLVTDFVRQVSMQVPESDVALQSITESQTPAEIMVPSDLGISVVVPATQDTGVTTQEDAATTEYSLSTDQATSEDVSHAADIQVVASAPVETFDTSKVAPEKVSLEIDIPERILQTLTTKINEESLDERQLMELVMQIDRELAEAEERGVSEAPQEKATAIKQVKNVAPNK